MFAAIAGLLLQPLVGPVSEPTQAEVDALEVCIIEAGPEAALRQCRGLVSTACMEQPGGETTAVQLACVRRELAIWTHELEKAERDMTAALETAYTPSRPEAFQAAQEAWHDFMRAECRQQSLLFEGGSFQRVLVADCVMRLTAERAVELAAQLAEIEA